jgi:hypothetical protein
VFKDEISFDLSVSLIYPEKVKKKPNQTDRWKIHMGYISFSIWSQFTTEILLLHHQIQLYGWTTSS